MSNLKMNTAVAVVMIVLLAGVAMAGEMNYSVYGKVHTSVNLLNDGNESGMALTSNLSHFGFKGSYGLNENFTAVWQLENQVNMAQKGAISEGNLFTGLTMRNSFVGVTGDWGTFVGGIHDTPMKMLGRKTTFFKDTIGDFRSTTMGFDLRLQDVVAYVLPAMDSGFGGAFAYMFDQNDWTANEEAATAFSGMLYYAPDNFVVGAAYETHAKGLFDTDPDAATEVEAAFRGVAKYDAEKFALSGLFQSVSNVGGVDGVSGQTIGFEGLFKAAPKWNVKGSYYMVDPNTDVDNDGAAQLAFGVDHVVTSAVTFYLQYALMSNDDGAAYGIGHNGFGATVDPAINADTGFAENPNGFSLGGIIDF